MLSNLSRGLTHLLAFLYTTVGLVLFFLPEQIAPVFAWKVTPFITMTIGGWCLGNAWLAWTAARRWRWALIYTALIYLWLFGFSELIVLYLFRGRLVLSHPVAWLYLITLMVNVITAVAGVLDWIRIRPSLEVAGPPARTLHYVLAVPYILFVGFLGVYGSTAPVGAPGTNGGIFPEVMSPFTLRSFGVFYLSLALSAVPLLWEKNLHTFLTHAYASYGLIIFITVAAVVYLRLFDFAARPGGLIYFAAYVLVGVFFLFEFRRSGTGLGN